MTQAADVILEAKKAIIGKDKILTRMFLAILAGGHILLEDIPGVGKTTMALAFSKALSLEYNRVQFNPDVLPSDITGFSIYNKNTGTMEYQKGAILCNLFLADELNRATSRTQSALLEAMEEGRVTVDGVTHAIPSPFTVIATQNPTGASGTQMLPDSQMDRFMIRLSIGYPGPEDELTMLKSRQNGAPLDNVQKVVTLNQLSEMKEAVNAVHVDNSIYQYVVRLVGATRQHSGILQGASPRASIALLSMAKAAAWFLGRDYVLPDDVKNLFEDVIAHRLLLPVDGEDNHNVKSAILQDILAHIPAPTIR